MEDSERKALAKELIVQASRELKEVAGIVFAEEDGTQILIASIGNSTLRLNLQERAEKIVEENEGTARIRSDLSSANSKKRAARHGALREIVLLILAIARHLDDAIWILDLLQKSDS